MKKTPLASAISTILAAGAFSAPVLAQDNAEYLEEDGTIEEVITTGSRIRKDAFTSSSPMDIIDVQEASVQGIANIGQLLQSNTLAAGSPQVTSATSFQFVQNGGLGASTLSLRGLGANRTLVLLNGRRAGPAGVQGGTSSFDLNVLPLSTIQRIEILKDGASSIYGSDAVAGVVNIITRKDDGGSIDAFFSAPSQSGGEQSRINASWGKSFERGNFRVTADYSRQEHLRRGDRDYFECGNELLFDRVTGERADNVDGRTGEFHCDDLTWGHVWIYDSAADSNVPNPFAGTIRSQFDYDGLLGGLIPGYAPATNPGQLTAPAGFFPVGYDRLSDSVQDDDHPFQQEESFIPKTELVTVYAEGEFEITENITAYGEVLLNRRDTESDGYRQYWSYIYSGDFDFGSLGSGVPGGGNTISAAAGWFGEQWYSPTAIIDHNDETVEVDYRRFVAGLRGSLGDRFDWDVAVQVSESDGDYTNDRVFDDSIRAGNFLPGSCVGDTFERNIGTLANPNMATINCVDVPWLDPFLLDGSNVSPEVRDFLFGVETGNTQFDQISVDASISGDLFEMPAGTFQFAAGIHYREDDLIDTPGFITQNSNGFSDQSAGVTTGPTVETEAVFAEVNVPLLVDRPGFRNLTLNASARYTDVNAGPVAIGDDTTWKVGLNWQMTDSMRLRANRGTSFRTPAPFELYLADQSGSISTRIDPCIRYEAEAALGNISEITRANCAADPRNLPVDYPGGSITPSVITGGGIGVLSPETSDSLTLGVIWQPQFANLSFSIDFFDIEVFDEVAQLGGAQIVTECYASEFGFAFSNSEPLCQLFDRSSINNGLDNIMDSFINIAEQRNTGFDFALRYITDTAWGNFTLDLNATLQTKDQRALFEDTLEDLNGIVGDPKWVGESNITLVRDKWSFFWGMDWVGSSSSAEEFRDINGRDFISVRGVGFDGVLSTKSTFYHSLSAQYSFEGGFTLLAGVANALDQAPPQLTLPNTQDLWTLAGNSVLESQYDPYGRRFFLNATYNFGQ